MSQKTVGPKIVVAFCALATVVSAMPAVAQEHFADPAALRVIPHLSDMQPA